MIEFSEKTRRWLAGAAVGACVCIAFALRWKGIAFGLPFAESRPDELNLAGKALAYGTGDLNPHFFNYPSLFSYILFLVYAVYILFVAATGAGHSIQEVMIGLAGDPSPLFIMSRSISVLAGVATLPILYRLCRQTFSRWTGVAATLFLAVAYLHVRESHFGVTDVMMTAWVTATMLFLVRVLNSGTRREYLAAGVLMGLAVSTKYNAALLVVPALLAHGLSRCQEGTPPLRRFLGANLWLMLACMAAAFALTSPFVLLDYHAFLRDFLFETRHLAGEGETTMSRGWIHHFRLSLWYGVGPWLLLASLVGAGVAITKQKRVALLLLAFPVLYYLAMGRGYTVFARYMVPAVPFVCLFAGVAVGDMFYPWLCRRTRPIAAGLATGILTLGLSLAPLSRSVEWDTFLCLTDTREQAIQYTVEHLKTGARIGWVGTRYGCPKFPESAESLSGQLNQARQEGAPGRFLALNLEAARRRGGGYDVEKFSAETFRGRDDTPTYVWTEYYPLAYTLQATRGAEDVLTARGFHRVVEFRGGSRDNLNRPGVKYDFQDSLYVPFIGCEQIERPGPTLTLWARNQAL